jgi:ATPase subunit of ABC transporter with duplicated ATPase domains
MKSVVLEFKEVSYREKDEESDLTEVSFSLQRGQRASLQCIRPEQSETIWRLLQTNLRPHKGNIDAPVRDQCYSDRLLEAGLDPQKTVLENLASPRFEMRPWVAGKPRTWQQIADMLEVSNSTLRRPLDSVEISDRQRIIWLFLWCLDVELLILESILEDLDQALKKLVFDWWEDSKGTILYLGKPAEDFSFQYHFAINADGHLIDRSIKHDHFW